MQPGDRIICAFLEEFAIGHTYKDWPLHITIIPWFRTPQTAEELMAELSEKLANASLAPFQIAVLGEAGFGHKGGKLVNLLAQPSPLDTIEEQARNVLHAPQAWIVDETNGFNRQYRPHITENKSGRTHEGDSIHCSAVYIIEQKGSYKEITGRIEL
jgi:2'-5' RNA ligase